MTTDNLQFIYQAIRTCYTHTHTHTHKYILYRLIYKNKLCIYSVNLILTIMVEMQKLLQL